MSQLRVPPLLAVALSGLCRQTSNCTQPPRKADKAFAGRQWVARVGSIRELWDGHERAAVSNMACVLACPFNVSAQGPSPHLLPWVCQASVDQHSRSRADSRRFTKLTQLLQGTMGEPDQSLRDPSGSPRGLGPRARQSTGGAPATVASTRRVAPGRARTAGEPPLAPQPSAAALPDGQGLPLLIQVMRAGLDARFQQHLARLQRLPPELREDYFQLSVVVPEEGPLIVDGEAADLRRQLGHLNAIGQAMSLWEDLLAKVERSLIQEMRADVDARCQQYVARVQRLPPELREAFQVSGALVPIEGPSIVDGEAADLRRQLEHLNASARALSSFEHELAAVERSEHF